MEQRQEILCIDLDELKRIRYELALLEAEEVSDEDLEAAANFYDRNFK